MGAQTAPVSVVVTRMLERIGMPGFKRGEGSESCVGILRQIRRGTRRESGASSECHQPTNRRSDVVAVGEPFLLQHR